MNRLTSDTHIMIFLQNRQPPQNCSQSSYKFVAILYLFCIAEIILYLIDDATIILQATGTQL